MLTLARPCRTGEVELSTRNGLRTNRCLQSGGPQVRPMARRGVVPPGISRLAIFRIELEEVCDKIREMKRPSAWIPLIMSATALTVVLFHLARFGTAPEVDEGTSAHVWQILMVGQLPIIAFFAVKWLPSEHRSARSELWPCKPAPASRRLPRSFILVCRPLRVSGRARLCRAECCRDEIHGSTESRPTKNGRSFSSPFDFRLLKPKGTQNLGAIAFDSQVVGAPDVATQ